jgi:hypothetical protein
VLSDRFGQFADRSNDRIWTVCGNAVATVGKNNPLCTGRERGEARLKVVHPNALKFVVVLPAEACVQNGI